MWIQKLSALIRSTVFLERRKQTLPVIAERRRICYRQAKQIEAESKARHNQTMRATTEELHEISRRM